MNYIPFRNHNVYPSSNVTPAQHLLFCFVAVTAHSLIYKLIIMEIFLPPSQSQIWIDY